VGGRPIFGLPRDGIAESLARGEPNRGKIAFTVLADKVREVM
jgi:hypothetical protein